MTIVVLWGLLVLLGQHAVVRSHVLGRSSSSNELTQLKSLLDRFEEILFEPHQNQNQNQDQDQKQDQDQDQEQEAEYDLGQGWNLDLERDQEPSMAGRSELHSRPAAQRNHLQDLLMSLRKRASSCFGARMDRIGNASGLGCNNGKG